MMTKVRVFGFHIACVAAVLSLLFASNCLMAAGLVNTQYVPGQVVVNFKASPTPSQLALVESKTNSKLASQLPVAGHWYLYKAENPSLTSSDQMVAALAGDNLVNKVLKVPYSRLAAIPNDTHWDLLWGMRMINAPAAWDIQKGSSSVRVAVIDTGIYLNHPEFAGRLLPGYDIADGDSDPNPPANCTKLNNWAAHGTHVAGIIAAQGNNGLGVVGVCWDNVKIIPFKVVEDESDDGVFPTTYAIEAMDLALRAGANVINMSWGGAVPWEPLELKCQELASAGIIMVASAGNDSGPVRWPAAYKSVIAVSAVGPNGTITDYSNTGAEIDIAAPGGSTANSVLDPNSIISTVFACLGGATEPQADYEGYRGTSMAAPHVTGAAALLLSNGVSPLQVRNALEGSAKPAGVGVPNAQYGHGILDVSAALRYTPLALEIERPRRGEIVTTTRPVFRISARGALANSLEVQFNGNVVISAGVPVDSSVEMLHTELQSFGTFVFTRTFAGPGSHTMRVSVSPETDPTRTISKTTSFTIRGLTLKTGRHLISVPYAVSSPEPSDLLGTSLYRMARYFLRFDRFTGKPIGHQYALNNYPGMNDPDIHFPQRANFAPEGVVAGEVTPDNRPSPLPRGVGYWLDLRQEVTLLMDTYTDDSYSYEVELYSGWQQIGNPYPYPIAWGNVMVDYLGEILPVTEAAKRGWISPVLYGFDGQKYVSEVAPKGVLEPWKGYWVKVKVPSPGREMKNADDPLGILTMIFSPLQASSSTSVSSGSAVTSNFGNMYSSDKSVSSSFSASRRRIPPRRFIRPDDFSIEFSVNQNSSATSGPVIGFAKNALDGLDELDRESPPPANSGAWATVVHSDWESDSGFYSVDFRSANSFLQQWRIRVYTYSAGPVDLGWGNLSSASGVYEIDIKDQTTGNILSPLASSYRFYAPSSSSYRDFFVTVRRRLP